MSANSFRKLLLGQLPGFSKLRDAVVWWSFALHIACMAQFLLQDYNPSGYMAKDLLIARLAMLPQEWRRNQHFSQEKIALLFGISGNNPARTWQRWESGERSPPLSVITKMEALSDGKVTTKSWLDVRQAFLKRQAISA